MLKIFNQTRYFTFALLLCFLAFETYCRIFLAEKRVLHDYPKIYAFDERLGYQGIPNLESHIRRSSINKHFRMNNQGFYGPDFNTTHPDSIYRIILFGSSVIEGIWANQKTSIAMLLDKKLKDAGYKTEVINCAISGANRHMQNIMFAEELAARFKADMVLYEQSIPVQASNYYRDRFDGYSILFTGSRPEDIALTRATVMKKVKLVKEHKLLTDFLKNCYIFRALVPNKDSGPIYEGTIRSLMIPYYNNTAGSWLFFDATTYDLKQSMKIMDNFKDSLQRINTRLVVFEYGDTWEISNHEVRLADISMDLPLANKRYLHKMDNHPNDSGYLLITNGLYKGLTEGFIPEKFRPLGDSARPTLAGAQQRGGHSPAESPSPAGYQQR